MLPYSHYKCLFYGFFIHFFLFCRCALYGLLRKLLCFLCFCHKENSSRFGPAIWELSIDFNWFQKLIQLILCIINKLKNFPPKFHQNKANCFWNMFIIIVTSFCKFFLRCIIFFLFLVKLHCQISLVHFLSIMVVYKKCYIERNKEKTNTNTQKKQMDNFFECPGKMFLSIERFLKR